MIDGVSKCNLQVDLKKIDDKNEADITMTFEKTSGDFSSNYDQRIECLLCLKKDALGLLDCHLLTTEKDGASMIKAIILNSYLDINTSSLPSVDLTSYNLSLGIRTLNGGQEDCS